MIARIRITGIRPGTLEILKQSAREWKALLESHGGRVLGFYFNESENKVIGIAEYESRAHLSEVQRRCEKDQAYDHIETRSKGIRTSFAEMIVEKLDI